MDKKKIHIVTMEELTDAELTQITTGLKNIEGFSFSIYSKEYNDLWEQLIENNNKFNDWFMEVMGVKHLFES